MKKSSRHSAWSAGCCGSPYWGDVAGQHSICVIACSSHTASRNSIFAQQPKSLSAACVEGMSARRKAIVRSRRSFLIFSPPS